MSKVCLMCKDGLEYKDNIGKCPKCNNFLKKLDKVDVTRIEFEEDPYKTYEEDPYKTYNQHDNIDYENTYLYGNQYSESQNYINEEYIEKRKPINNKKNNDNHICITGVAHKIFKEDKELKGFEKITTFFEKIFNSLFGFEPYPLTNETLLFQLYYDEGFGDRYEDIIIRGKLDSSQITEGNRIEVKGKRNKKGEILASSIYKKGSNVTIKPSFVISPIIVWVIMLSIMYGGYRIVTMDWKLIFQVVFTFLFQIVFIVGFFWIIFKMLIKSIFGK